MAARAAAAATRHVVVVIDYAGQCQTQRFPLRQDDPAGVLCDLVAAHLKSGDSYLQKVHPSQVYLIANGVLVQLWEPLTLDIAGQQLVAQVHEGMWHDLVREWHEPQLEAAVERIAVEPFGETKRVWGDSAEFGAVVRLIDEMLHNFQANADEDPPDPPASWVLRSLNSGRGEVQSLGELAVNILRERTYQLEYMQVQLRDGKLFDSRRLPVLLPPGQSTAAACCEKVAQCLPGVDPSQVRVETDGVPASALHDVRDAVGVAAAVVEETWRDTVVCWRRDLRNAGTIADFVDELAARPGVGDGETWGSSGEFGELVRLLDGLLVTGPRRSADSADARDAVKLQQVCDFLADEAAKPGATLRSLLEAVYDEYGD